MEEYISAEEFYSSYLKTKNPFAAHLSRFEYYRVKILISKELIKAKEKLYLYLLDIYIDIKIGKANISPFYVRLLKQNSEEGNGLASFLIYYCYKNNISPFSKKEYLNYLFKARDNGYYLSYISLLNEHLFGNINLSSDDTKEYIGKINDNQIRDIYNLYFQLREKDYINNEKIIKKLEQHLISDNPIIFIMLGKIFDEGRYAQEDIDKAIEYYKHAAEYKEIYAINYLAEIYISGRVPINIKESLYYYKQSLHLKPDNILKIIKLRIETKEINKDEVELIIQTLQKINSVDSSILLGRVYLEYQYLKKEKEGMYLLNYYGLTNPSLYYYLYLFYTKKNNRKEAIRYLRRGVVKKDKKCIEEAKGYKKLTSLIG